MNRLKVFFFFSLIATFLSTYAAVPNAELVAIDNNGMKFTIEVYYESENNPNLIDVILYKNSEPSSKVYGHGTAIRNRYYINTDTPLFDFAFPNGEYKTMQPFKKIMNIFFDDDNFFIAPTDTKDPGWRIPYSVYKINGRIITPKERSSDNKHTSTPNLTPLRGDMFAECFDINEYFKVWNIGVNPDYFKSIGFSESKEGILIRDDAKIEEVCLTGDGEICKKDDDECVYQELYITFTSKPDAQSFLQTFRSMGWEEFDVDAFHSGGGDNDASARLEGLTVIISR